MTDEELIEKTWGRTDPDGLEGLFLKRLHEAAGNQQEFLKFIEVIRNVGGRLNQLRGLDDSGELLRDKHAGGKQNGAFNDSGTEFKPLGATGYSGTGGDERFRQLAGDQ